MSLAGKCHCKGRPFLAQSLTRRARHGGKGEERRLHQTDCRNGCCNRTIPHPAWISITDVVIHPTRSWDRTIPPSISHNSRRREGNKSCLLIAKFNRVRTGFAPTRAPASSCRRQRLHEC